MPHEAFLGNHDYYGLHDDLDVDGYALLGQAPAPRAIDFGGWRLVLLDTVEPGEHHTACSATNACAGSLRCSKRRASSARLR